MLENSSLLCRCRRLGDEVSFSYCLRESDPFPCRLIMDCWKGIFLRLGLDIEKWLKNWMEPEMWSQFATLKTTSRLSHLLEESFRKGEGP